MAFLNAIYYYNIDRRIYLNLSTSTQSTAGDTDNDSAQHFDSKKLTNFSCAPDGIRTSGHGIHWILRPMLYQLSHHDPSGKALVRGRTQV